MQLLYVMPLSDMCMTSHYTLWHHMMFCTIYEWMAQWYISDYCIFFPLKFRTLTYEMSLKIMKGMRQNQEQCLGRDLNEISGLLVGERMLPTLRARGILPPNQLARYFFQISALTCSWLYNLLEIFFIANQSVAPSWSGCLVSCFMHQRSVFLLGPESLSLYHCMVRIMEGRGL